MCIYTLNFIYKKLTAIVIPFLQKAGKCLSCLLHVHATPDHTMSGVLNFKFLARRFGYEAPTPEI